MRVVVLDTQGRIVSFNRACEQATGYSLRFPNTHENICVGRDGSRCRIAWTNTALLDSEGAVEVEEMTFRTSSVSFAPVAVLALFTNGVTEAGDPADLPADGGVCDLMERLEESDAGAITTAIRDHTMARAERRRSDDTAIVVIRRFDGEP